MPNNIEITLSANARRLDEAINRSSKTIHNFGDKSIAVLNRVGRTIRHVGDQVMTPFAGIASAAGIAVVGKSMMDFDARLARMAIQAKMSKKEMYQLKDNLFAIGRETYRSPIELLEAMEPIIEKSGNLELAVGALRDMGYAGSASGAAMKDIGSVVSTLHDKFGIAKKDIKAALDILIDQGNEGAFTLKQIGDLGERLFTSAASWGVQGMQGVREFGAFIQLARGGTGSAEQATTATERAISDMIQNRKKIEKMTGFSIIDAEESKKQGRAVFKNFVYVIKEIVRRTKGDRTKLDQFFGEESIRAINWIAESYKKFGDFRMFDNFIKRGGDGKETMREFAFWTGMTAAKAEQFRTTLLKFANDNLARPVEKLGEALDFLNNHPVVTKGGIWAILGLGGTVGAMKLWDFIKDIYEVFMGKRSRKTGGSGDPGEIGGVQRVYVVNMPSNFGNPLPGPGTPPGVPPVAKRSLPTLLKSALPWIARYLPLTAGTYATYEAIDYMDKPDVKAESLRRLAEAAAVDRRLKESTQTIINMRINVDQAGRSVAETDNMNAKLNIILNRGKQGR